MIDNIMLINLKRRKDKWFFGFGWLHGLGYPGDRIIRFDAHDGKDYETTQDVVAAAVVDGFEFFGNYNDGEAILKKHQLCWFWSYCGALRTIIEMDKTVMLLLDDMLPYKNWQWNRTSALVSECIKANADEGQSFKGLQLCYGMTPQRRPPDVPIYSSMLREGIFGLNENGYVFSKDGASMFLEVYGEQFPKEIVFAGETISIRGLENDEYRKGWWTVLDEVVGYSFDWESDLWGAERLYGEEA